MVGEHERQRRLLEEVAALYDWIDTQAKQDAARAGRCRACGACCDFSTYEHRLFVTPPELAYLAARLSTTRFKIMAGGGCPYQQGTVCTVHEHRFAACRIFCCDGDPDFQSALSEEALRRLKALCEAFGVPYHYQELAAALAGFNSGTFRSASGACPADRTG
jgi:Fe-S-cluster containining protein